MVFLIVKLIIIYLELTCKNLDQYVEIKISHKVKNTAIAVLHYIYSYAPL